MPQLSDAEFAEWSYKSTVYVLEMEGKTEIVGWLKRMKEREVDISDVEQLIRKFENMELQHADVCSIFNSIGLFVSKKASHHEVSLLWLRVVVEYLESPLEEILLQRILCRR